MASKVMVKLPVAPFGQVNKSKTGTVSSEVVIQKPLEPTKDEDEDWKSPEQVRLEQNIKFLQDQHQLMLTGLQGEIEKLKSKNRELQFQLIFGKAPISSSSPSPSSPEDDKHKLYTSPRGLNNTTPLQVELLEKEIGELKVQMTEQESRNVYLSAIVDEQKKQLERYDRRREKEQQRTAPGDLEVELLRKLEDAETLIRQLRRENSDLRRENQELQSEPTPSGGHGQYREQNGQDRRGYRGGGGRGHRSGNNGHNNGYYNSRGGWFPPVHTQNFWQGNRSQHERPLDGPNLPDLPPEGASHYHHHQGPHHGRKGPNNNHHYQNGEGRKYKGGHNNHKGSKPS